MLKGKKATDLEIGYQQHRLRVQNAKSVVNSNPPLKKQAEPYQELSYIEMLTTMRRDMGRHVRTFTKSPDRMRQRLRHHHKRHHSCQMPMMNPEIPMPIISASALSPPSWSLENRKLGGKSCPAISTYHTGQLGNNGYAPFSASTRQVRCSIPQHVLQRYNFLASPRNVGTLHRLLRPKLFLDMEVRGLRPLGRVVLQLYTEACPEVVLEFVRTCLEGNCQRIHFTRLLPPLWLEGELTLDDKKALTAPNIEHDLDVIDHGAGSGILSFPSRYVRGVCKRRSLTFTISFKPINTLNGKRIAFGRVKRGSWIFDTVQDLRTKNGKPLHEIFVQKCGLVQ